MTTIIKLKIPEHVERNASPFRAIRAAATTLKTADQTIYHDPAHPSAILLPVKG